MTAGQVQRWRLALRGGEITTARYEAGQTGQAYRAMHAALLEVARLADPDAKTTEALFERAGTVLLVHYNPADEDERTGYVVVEPGDYLACWGPGVLDAEPAGSLTDWYEPVEGERLSLARLVADAATAEIWPGQVCVLRDGKGTLRVGEDGATTVTVRDVDGKALLVLPVWQDIPPGGSLYVDLARWMVQ